MSSLSDSLVALRMDDAVAEARLRVDGGEDPAAIIRDCREGMEIVGERFKEGEFFLAELVLTGQIFDRVMEVLEPHILSAGDQDTLARVVLATPKGDIHDLGKNIVATTLRSAGFEVHDLGVDVDPDVIIDSVRSLKPQFVGFSALLTTTLPALKRTVDVLTEEGLRPGFKLLIGGGVTTPHFREHIGADLQTLDVMEGVDYCLATVRESPD